MAIARPSDHTPPTRQDADEKPFPKGLDSLWEASMEKCGLLDALDPPVVCKHCKGATKEPYIQCVQCEKLGNFSNVIICVPCFAKGVEFDKHRNDHSYIVIRTDFCLFEPKWQAKDELRLINAINDCGVGNWQDVSYRMQGKSTEECKAHYMKYYIDSDHPELSKILRKDLGHTVHPQPVSYVGGTDDPPRPLPGTSSYRDMAGYNAARGDFDVEHDNTAEVDIQDLDLKLFEEDEKPSLGFELQVALLDIYRRRLGERHRRKKLIKNHGLIAMSKSIMMLNRYRSCLPQPFADALPRFFSIFDSVEFDLLLEGLKCETELKRQVFDLMEYRSIGITKQVSIMTYETLKKRRDLNFRERRNLVCMQNYGVDTKWNILKKVAKLETAIPGSSRRVSIPLNIVGMPGYESLNYTEKQIASELRLVPEDFLRFKSAFINECRKLNGLKLGQARTLIRIDVNKIRKIYDYLLSAGLIHTPSK